MERFEVYLETGVAVDADTQEEAIDLAAALLARLVDDDRARFLVAKVEVPAPPSRAGLLGPWCSDCHALLEPDADVPLCGECEQRIDAETPPHAIDQRPEPRAEDLCRRCEDAPRKGGRGPAAPYCEPCWRTVVDEKRAARVEGNGS